MSKSASSTKVVMDNSSVRPDFSSYVAVTLWLGWLFLFPIMLLFLPIFWIYFKPAFYILFVVILTSAIYPIDREYQPFWGYQLGSWIMHKACGYFSLRVEFENHEAVDKGGPCIYALEPHGVLPVSIFWCSLLYNYTY